MPTAWRETPRAVGISRSRSSVGPIRTRNGQPIARLATDRDVLEFRYAPRGATLGGWARRLEIVDRPGRAPLVLDNGPALPTLALRVFVGEVDHQTSVEPVLAHLRALAASGDRITVGGLSLNERGPWRLESVDPTIELRQARTNHATRATVELKFVAASDARVRLGPVTGGKGKGTGKGEGTRRYTVRAGDTLAGIADKFYGEPGKWRLIARRNSIKRPASIKAGDVLVIPPDEQRTAVVVGGR